MQPQDIKCVKNTPHKFGFDPDLQTSKEPFHSLSNIMHMIIWTAILTYFRDRTSMCRTILVTHNYSSRLCPLPLTYVSSSASGTKKARPGRLERPAYGLEIRKKCAWRHTIRNPMQAYACICYHLLEYKFDYKVEYKWNPLVDLDSGTPTIRVGILGRWALKAG